MLYLKSTEVNGSPQYPGIQLLVTQNSRVFY